MLHLCPCFTLWLKPAVKRQQHLFVDTFSPSAEAFSCLGYGFSDVWKQYFTSVLFFQLLQ